ncbi:glycosyltransferase family 1 protein [Shewanella xiamenensis]|uniref:glycosyltransferase family 4 protein n=1 Tax=Shewanella xiamenensis TaxID=332186 RepID=UPI00313A78F3
MIQIDGIIFSLQKMGGVSICFEKLLANLNADGLDYSIDLFPHGSRCFNEGLHSRAINFLKPKFGMINFERFCFAKLNEQADVFHSSYYRIPSRNSQSCKVITTVHDFTHEKYIPGIKSKLFSHQKKAAILSSDTVICISESTKRDMFEIIPESKGLDVQVVHNGVSNKYEYLNLERKDYVVFVGSRVGYKNFLPLVDALALSERFSLCIIGGGELNTTEIEYLNLKLPNKFTHHLFLDEADLNLTYNQAHCLVYPSSYEGFGIPPIEAMKAGCPVVALSASSLPEVCGDAAILLEIAKPEEIHSAIKELEVSVNRNKLMELGFVNSSRFSWEKNYQEIKSLYLR